MAFMAPGGLSSMNEKMVVENPQLTESHTTNLAGIRSFPGVLAHVDFHGFLLGEPERFIGVFTLILLRKHQACSSICI